MNTKSTLKDNIKESKDNNPILEEKSNAESNHINSLNTYNCKVDNNKESKDNKILENNISQNNDIKPVLADNNLSLTNASNSTLADNLSETNVIKPVLADNNLSLTNASNSTLADNLSENKAIKPVLADYDLSELEGILLSYNQPKYRAKQLKDNINLGKSYDKMTNIPESIKNILSSNYTLYGLEIIEQFKSADGTVKYLFKLDDNNIIEGVLMKYSYGYTLCVSTQVGCRMNCSFCASTIGGLVRNMTAGEILSQVILVNAAISDNNKRAITNVVLMGSGEPLDNYDNVVKFIKLLIDKDGLNISARNISLSTSGIVDKIRDLADLGMSVNLTISLHSAFDEVREKLMPVNKKYPITDLIIASRYYFNKTGRRVYIEYAMIEGVNDRDIDAQALGELLRGFPCHLNLIRLNYVKEKGHRGTRIARIKKFMQLLDTYKVSNTLRRSMGADIDGACGQLRKKYIDSVNKTI